MDEHTENRFKLYKEKSIDELIEEKNKAEEEIAYYNKILEDPKAPKHFKSEILNSDLRFEEDKLAYINNLLNELDYSSKKR